MPELEIQPFSDTHLDGAVALLAERHARHREAEPLLLETIDFRGEIAALWAREGASGGVALRGKVVGYLLGAERDDDSGARTSGSVPPATPSKRRKMCAISMPPSPKSGSKSAGPGIT